MSNNKHITNDQRNEISILLQQGYNQTEIANITSKNKSSISREIKRNSRKNGKYHARIAKEKNNKRRFKVNQRNKINNNYWLSSFVKKKTRKYWSPEEISGTLLKFYGTKISTECIYQYLYKEYPKLEIYLRHNRKGKYRRKRGTIAREKQRERDKKKRVDERPEVINNRERLGDFEGDLIIGTDKKTAIATYVDRRSNYTIIQKLDIRSADMVNELAIQTFSTLPKNKRHSITYDNGSEFDKFVFIEKYTGMTIYFAYPYHSWERGTNENTNGLIRQFIPKKISLKEITQKKLDEIAYLLNSRPRKKLDYATPLDVWSEKVAF